jgi:hypothetical protein
MILFQKFLRVTEVFTSPNLSQATLPAAKRCALTFAKMPSRAAALALP